MNCRIRRWVLATVLVMSCASVGRAEFLLTDNDRVVLFADASFGHSFAPEWFCQFVRTRYPDLKLEFYSLAKTRSDAADGNKRLAQELLPLKPTWVILSFGLDSPNRQPFQQARLDSYVKEMSAMIDTIKTSGAKILVFTPPPPEEAKHKSLKAAKFDDVISKYADALRTLAKSKDVEVLDWHKAGSEFKAKLPNNPNLHWTKRGLQPLGLSLSVAIDLLLERFGAEPLEYKIEADWNTTTATVSSGTVKVTKHSPTSMEFKLTDVPATLDMNARGKVQQRSWPLAKWCKLTWKINNMPPSGVIVSSDKQKRGKPFLKQQFEVGADMSQIGPLAKNDHVGMLHNAVRTKLGQCSKYRETITRPVPEPELAEGYRLYRLADTELMFAAQKIENRTPSRYDTTVRITQAPKSPKPSARPNRKKPASKTPATKKPANNKGN